MINQRRIPGIKREALHPSVLPQIRRIVEQTSRKFNVSKSFVIATALADYFKVKEQERYYIRETVVHPKRRSS